MFDIRKLKIRSLERCMRPDAGIDQILCKYKRQPKLALFRNLRGTSRVNFEEVFGAFYEKCSNLSTRKSAVLGQFWTL